MYHKGTLFLYATPDTVIEYTSLKYYQIKYVNVSCNLIEGGI
jgi:hypothetical protein